MREFTKCEKELIASTPITNKCFEMDNFERLGDIEIINGYFTTREKSNDLFWNQLTLYLEVLRQKYNETKDERYFIELVRLLPGSYKVVNLAEMPDLEKITNGIIQRTR